MGEVVKFRVSSSAAMEAALTEVLDNSEMADVIETAIAEADLIGAPFMQAHPEATRRFRALMVANAILDRYDLS